MRRSKVRRHNRKRHLRGGRFVREHNVDEHYRSRRLSKKVMRKYKKLAYPQLRRRFRIPAYRDDDGDKVVNVRDCRPWDKKRQDDYRDTMLTDLERLGEKELELQRKKEYLKQELENIGDKYRAAQDDEYSQNEWGHRISQINNDIVAIDEELENIENAKWEIIEGFNG